MGYSNVQGDINVYGTSYLNVLNTKGSATFNGILSSTLNATFANAIVSNLTVTNSFVITSTNLQSSNAISIVKSGNFNRPLCQSE
jgi:hypothetical protein